MVFYSYLFLTLYFGCHHHVSEKNEGQIVHQHLNIAGVG